MNYEKILDDFVKEERKKSQMGSGDDMFFEQQIIDYVTKQRGFLVDFVKFVEKKVLEEQK